MPINDIDVSLYTGLKASSLAPRISTKTADAIAGIRGGGNPAPYNPVGILFQDSFDAHPDWHSGLPENDLGGLPGSGFPDTVQSTEAGHSLPQGWDYVYQNPTLAPSIGDNDKREVISILGSDSTLARGGSGKAFVQQRVASDGGSWTSDGQMLKLLGAGYSSLYVEFWIAFDPIWTKVASADQAKIFRIGSWNGQQPIFEAFPDGNQGPLFIWDWQSNNYGVRNLHALRGGPHGTNYYLTPEQEGGLPRSSMNFTQDTVGMGVGGSTPQITDKLNGGFISDNLNQTVTHEQIFGSAGTFTKLAYFVQVNSAPGVADGRLMQWIDDEQILNVTDINWVPSLPAGVTSMPKWNFFSIGGNDFFREYTTADRRQEYWVLDDLIVRDNIPGNLL